MRLPTGAKPLDELLGGGVEVSAVTNICGEPGTGKTNICMLAALSCISQKKKVVFIDTEGGFSVERFGQLCDDAKGALKEIIFFEPKTFREQCESIEKSSKLCDKQPIGLLILDSAVALYRLEYAENDNVLDANRELGRQLSMLSSLARDKNIPVIVTNHVFRKYDTNDIDIVGGDAIKYWCKAIVQLERGESPGMRKATLVKHRSLSEGALVEFELAAEGIRPAERRFKFF